MRRGWEVEYIDGTLVNEEQLSWGKVIKRNIVSLTLKYDGREWRLSGKQAYLQKKRGSVIPSIPGSFRVEARSIGYYDKKCKVWYTVDEATGHMSMTTEEF
jgi:hypothetical protein